MQSNNAFIQVNSTGIYYQHIQQFSPARCSSFPKKCCILTSLFPNQHGFWGILRYEAQAISPLTFVFEGNVTYLYIYTEEILPQEFLTFKDKESIWGCPIVHKILSILGKLTYFDACVKDIPFFMCFLFIAFILYLMIYKFWGKISIKCMSGAVA